MTTSKGTLVLWLDYKGYGFIKQVNGEPDIFIHISTLKGMSRKPVIGDVIHYRIGFDKSGKSRAIDAKNEGVSQALTDCRSLTFFFGGLKGANLFVGLYT